MGWESQIKHKYPKSWAEPGKAGRCAPTPPQESPTFITQGEVPGPAALTPLGNLLKMQTPRPHPRPTIYSILWMRKLEHTEVRKLASSRPAGRP